MPLLDRRAFGFGAIALALPAAAAARTAGAFFDVRDQGARGDGVAIDSGAINRAIAAAVKAGGGTVVVPAGRYLCFSIRLQSDITLLLSPGAVIVAADPAIHHGAYDLPEVELDEQFQDFGITHIHNSLIYADGASNIAILGHGRIEGHALDRADPGDRWHGRAGWQSPAALGVTPRVARLRDPKERAMEGRGNKAIGLRDCRNVVLRDFTILIGGHFGVMAHGVSNMVLENLTVDTDRDGIDIDCCRDVRVANCLVNAPKDDAIVIKSSYALGRKVACENITVTGCKTSGYLAGSVVDGSFRPSDYGSTDSVGVLGRIKLGTESNGGFRNIIITGCTCENTRGILIGVVDGGVLEDVTVSNIILRNPVNHPLFVHQSARLRAPAGTTVGACRRIRFDGITVSGADGRYPCGVAGIPGYDVEDVVFSEIDVTSGGGGTASDAAALPPEQPRASLEVSFMRTLPAFGFYARHARRVTLRNASFTTSRPDARPAVVFDEVTGAIVDGLASPSAVAGAVVSRTSRDIVVGIVRTA